MKQKTLSDGVTITALSFKDKIQMAKEGKDTSHYPEIQVNGKTFFTVTIEDEDELLRYGINEYKRYKKAGAI